MATDGALMLSALSFLTPLGRVSTPDSRTMEWFGFVGAAIGSAVGGVWWAASQAFHPVVAAALALAADAILTGGLHLDGLVDSADGLLPPLPRARRLEVMRDPAVGAFGAVTVVVVLILRFAAFASAAPSVLVVAGLWGLSRTAMAVVSWTVPYARSAGLASAFLGDSGDGDTAGAGRSQPRPGARAGVVLGSGLATCVALGIFGRGAHGLAALGTGAIACGAVALFARARLGGFTGDVLGAMGVVGETVGLLVLSARW